MIPQISKILGIRMSFKTRKNWISYQPYKVSSWNTFEKYQLPKSSNIYLQQTQLRHRSLFLFLRLKMISLRRSITVYWLTLSSSMFHFYTPWKRQKTFGFLTFSGAIKIENWVKNRLIFHILSFLRICSHLLKKSSMEIFIFCAVTWAISSS